jgi:hypothetical protein
MNNNKVTQTEMDTNVFSTLTPEVKAMAEKILAKVASYGSVSFAELNRIEGFSGGEWESLLPNTAVVLWAGMTDEGCKAWDFLAHSKLIEMKPSTPLVYWLDGASVNLPLTKGSNLKRYKKPHWLPVVFNATKAGSQIAKSIKCVEAIND